MEKREKRRREKEEGRRTKRIRRKRNSRFENFVWIYWLGNYPNSFFVYVWVRKTLTLQYMCILVGLSQFWVWFSFNWKISGENGKNWPFL